VDGFYGSSIFSTSALFLKVFYGSSISVFIPGSSLSFFVEVGFFYPALIASALIRNGVEVSSSFLSTSGLILKGDYSTSCFLN
jgi:hypothetical protein